MCRGRVCGESIHFDTCDQLNNAISFAVAGHLHQLVARGLDRRARSNHTFLPCAVGPTRAYFIAHVVVGGAQRQWAVVDVADNGLQPRIVCTFGAVVCMVCGIGSELYNVRLAAIGKVHACGPPRECHL